MATTVAGLSVVACHDAGTDFTNAHDTDPNEIAATTVNAVVTAARPTQGAEATTADDTSVVTAANILTGIIKCTPTADRAKATDTAANLISSLGLTEDNASFDFVFINLATDGASAVTLSAGSGVTLVGRMVIMGQDAAEDAIAEGVAQFRVRRTSSSAVTMYRIG